jgi:hypothetical protein
MSVAHSIRGLAMEPKSVRFDGEPARGGASLPRGGRRENEIAVDMGNSVMSTDAVVCTASAGVI